MWLLQYLQLETLQPKYMPQRKEIAGQRQYGATARQQKAYTVLAS